MKEKDLRFKIRGIISELFLKSDKKNTLKEYQEEEENGLLDLAGQFDLPGDIDYTPTDKDKKDIEDIWGTYENKPMGDEEKKQISDRIKRAKLRLPNDEKELDDIQASLDAEKIKTPGGIAGKKMKQMGISIN